MPDTDVSTKAFYQYLLGVKAPSTAHKYKSYALEFLKLMSRNGYQSFADIPAHMLQDYVSMLAEQGKTASTMRVQAYAVKKYLTWVKNRGVRVPQQNEIELPRVQIRIRECLPPEHFTLYFRQADQDLEEPVRTAVMLLPCCGLRANELVTLRLDSIRSVKTLVKKRHKVTYAFRVRGKGGKERIVPLMDEGAEILVGYLSSWRKRRSGPWLFPKSALGTDIIDPKVHISTRSLRLAIQELREPLGMEFTPHTMRRTYLTMLHRKGLDLKTLANIAGHSSIQTTIDHYLVTSETDNIDALARHGGALAG